MVTRLKVTVSGNLTDDPNLERTSTGSPYAKLRIAVNTGQGENRVVDYYDVRVWSNEYAPDFPENVCSSLHRGDRVTVTGNVEASAWTSRDGSLRSGLTIHADEVSASLRRATAVITRVSREDSPMTYGNRPRALGSHPAPTLAAGPPDPFLVTDDDELPF